MIVLDGIAERQNVLAGAGGVRIEEVALRIAV